MKYLTSDDNHHGLPCSERGCWIDNDETEWHPGAGLGVYRRGLDGTRHLIVKMYPQDDWRLVEWRGVEGGK